MSGLLLWPLAGLVILIVAWRRKTLRRALLDLVVIFAVAGLVAGWWYLRSWRLYGDLSGVGSITAIMPTRTSPLTLGELGGELQGLRFSYWGMFGWFNVPSPLWAYRIADVLTVLALVGLPFALAPRRAGRWGVGLRRADLPWLVVPAAWLGLVLLALLRYDLILPALQGRLVMPAAWAVNLFLVLGWAGLVSQAGRLVRHLTPPARHSTRRSNGGRRTHGGGSVRGCAAGLAGCMGSAGALCDHQPGLPQTSSARNRHSSCGGPG